MKNLNQPECHCGNTSDVSGHCDNTQDACKQFVMSKMNKKTRRGKRPAFGMLSVMAGIDNNPKPTQADRIAGAKMKK